MISSGLIGFGRYVPIISLAIYSLLFILVALLYCIQSSTHRTLHLTLIVSIFGMVYSSCVLAESLGDSVSFSRNMAAPILFFGLFVVPTTWMVGISLFSILFNDGKTIQSRIANFITMFIFSLILLSTFYYTRVMKPVQVNMIYSDLYTAINIFKTIICVEWTYFFVYISLVLRYKHFIPRKLLISLITFGALNSVRLIVDTFYLKAKDSVDQKLAVYIQFFFTDLTSVISLFVSTVYWSSLKPIDYRKYINESINK